MQPDTSVSHSPARRPRFQILSWTLFDFANTAFYVIILTVAYPLYFKEIVARGRTDGDFLWGATFSISMLVVALISPILGAAADEGAGKKRFLLAFTLLCVGATALLFGVKGGDLLSAMVLVILANIGFAAGLVFYDAFLPELTTERSYGRVSGYGFGMGYVGSLATLAAAFPLLRGGFAAENLLNVRTTFLMAAGIFLLFSLPMFLAVREKGRAAGFRLGYVKIGFSRVASTLRDFSRYRNVGRFLLSYFLYIDAINTVIVFSSIFARETFGMDMGEIILFFILVQSSAIGGSVIFGIAADRLGQKLTLTITLVIWLCITGAAYVLVDKTLFYLIGAAAGIAMGSAQATSRSMLALISPPDKKTEFFGFYSFFGKASAIIGPLMFGSISSAASQRAAILSIGLLFALGLLLLQRVKEHRFEAEQAA